MPLYTNPTINAKPNANVTVPEVSAPKPGAVQGGAPAPQFGENSRYEGGQNQLPQQQQQSARPADMFADAVQQQPQQRQIEFAQPRMQQQRQQAEQRKKEQQEQPQQHNVRPSALLAGVEQQPAQAVQSGYAQPAQPPIIEAQPTAEQPMAPVDVASEVADQTDAQQGIVTEQTVEESPGQGNGAEVPPSPNEPGTIPPKDMDLDENILSDPRPVRIAQPQGKPNVATAKAFQRVKAKNKIDAVDAGKRAGRGNAVWGVIVSDPNVGVDEVSIGTREMVAAYEQPESMLRQLVAKYAPEADQQQMQQDHSYAAYVIADMFDTQDIKLMTVKYPTPAEADGHLRTVRVHAGTDARLHPLSAKMFNADADGDKLSVVLDENAVEGTKSAMDFLVGTDADLRIDPDFFGLAPWAKSKEELSEILRAIVPYTGVRDASVSALATALEKAQTGDKAGYTELVRVARKFGTDYAGIRGKEAADLLTARLLKTIYDYNAEIWTARTFSLDGYWYVAPEQYNGTGVLPYAVDSDLIKGSMPANLYDYAVSINAPIGQVERKNPQFRAFASIGKRIKPDRRLVVGKDTWANRQSDEWTLDAEELIAKQMSGIVGHGESNFGPATYLRSRIIRKTGFPTSPKYQGDLKKFMDAFVVQYNFYQRVVEASQLVMRSDFSLYSPTAPFAPIRYKGNNEDVRAAFKAVYGEYTMQTLFGQDAPGGFEHASLETFIADNRDRMLSGKTKLSSARGFVKSLADMRTSQAAAFNTQFSASLQKQFGQHGTKLKEALSKKKHKRDYIKETEILAESMFMLGRDPFMHFKFQNVDSFRNTDVGKAFVEAKDPDDLGGMVYELVARYRFDSIYRARENGNEQLAQERLDELATISDLWRHIVYDFRNNGNLVNGILMNRELGKADKEKALVQHFKDNPLTHNYLQESQVAYELMANPTGLYAGTKTTTDFARGKLLDNFKAADRLIDAAVKETYEAIKSQVEKAVKVHGEEAVLDFVNRVGDGRYDLQQISVLNYCDALYSGMEKTYKSTEKNSQEPSVDLMYVSAAHARNGGMFSDMAICDDFFLGKMPIDRFLKWPFGLAKILTDEAYSIEVYDAYGSTVLTKRSFLADDRPSTLTQFLIDNPRIAMALRSSGVQYNTAIGKPVVVATRDLVATISHSESDAADLAVEKVFTSFADKPGFAALSVCLQKMTGMKKSQLLANGEKSVVGLVKNLMVLAKYDGDVPSMVDEMVDGLIGDSLDSYDGHIENVKEQISEHMKTSFTSYITQIQSMGIDDVLASIDDSFAPDLTFWLKDRSVVQAYFDVVQTFSGAKTNQSTEINGGESMRNAPLAYLAQDVPMEDCMAEETLTVDAQDFMTNWSDYSRRKTRDGRIIDVDTWQEIYTEAVENGIQIEIEIPEACQSHAGPCRRHLMGDTSTNPDPETHTTPLGRWMLVMRTFGTEQLNLKVKTVGDDHKDSMTKVSVFDIENVETAVRTKAAVSDAYAREGLPGARRELASRLEDKNKELGYEALNADDYVDIAKLMIKEVDGDVYVMSIGQMSIICKQALSDLMIETDGKLSFDEIVDACTTAIEAYDPTSPLDVDEIIARMNVLRQGRMTSVTDSRANSVERNAQLIERLQSENRIVADPVETEKLINQLKNDNRDAAYYTKTKLPGYELIGVARKNFSSYVPVVGQKSVVYIDESAPIEDVKGAINEAYRLGATVLLPGYMESEAVEQALKLNNGGMGRQVVTTPDGARIIPFFQIRLNGGNTTGRMGAFNTGVYRIDPSNVVRMVEDPHNTMRLTDSDFQAFQDFADRVSPTATGRYEVDVNSSFSVFMDSIGDADATVYMPGRAEIEGYIVNGYDAPLNIDLGYAVEPDGNDAKRADEAIDRYIEKFRSGLVDDNGWVTDASPDEIVGWIRAFAQDKDGATVDAWHPVRLFDIDDGKSAPDGAKIEGYGFDMNSGNGSRGKLMIDWSYQGELAGNTFKLFESWFSADKMMGRPDILPSRKLRNGAPVDIMVAGASTSGRRLTYKMQQSMATLMAEARLTGTGYNFADVEGTFPNDAEFKQQLSEGSLRISDWSRKKRTGPIEFFPEGTPDKAVMDAFCNQLADSALAAGVNPSDVFASSYNGVPTYHWFRFNVLFSSSVQFMNNIMRFFNFIDPSICPPNIGGDASGTLFDGELRMLVPFTDSRGNVYEDWAHVYTGLHYLDSHYSGFAQPGRRPTSIRSTSMANAHLYGGKKPNETQIKEHVGWALSDVPQELSNTWLLAEDEQVED